METINFLDNISYHEDRPKLTLMLETSFSKEISIALKAGQELKDHKAPSEIIVQVIQGEINFGVGEELFLMKAGTMITLKEKVMHNLTALADSVVRLTIQKQAEVPHQNR